MGSAVHFSSLTGPGDGAHEGFPAECRVPEEEVREALHKGGQRALRSPRRQVVGELGPESVESPASLDSGKRANWVVRTLFLIYRGSLRPMIGSNCRFEPSCSTFTEDAIAQHGFWRGCALGLRRLLRCHPFHPGGYDPVPPVRIDR